MITGTDQAVIECAAVTKTFSEGNLRVDVLKGISLRIGQGEQVAIVGASGSGKSTLLHILGGLSKPTTGEVRVDNRAINTLSEAALGQLRNQVLGFVYQFHHLLPEFTALENIAMPLLIRKTTVRQAFLRAEQLLKRVGLSDRMGHKPGELSGGERQRAAVARAVVTQPSCILADEPTGNLDASTADSIHQLMIELNEENRTSLVIVTHDMALAGKMGRMVRIENGLVTEE